MGRLIDESKIKITCETFTDADGEILVPLSAVKRAIAMAPAADVTMLVFNEIEEKSKLLFDGVCNIIVLTETDFEKIKKKYTEGEK